MVRRSYVVSDFYSVRKLLRGPIDGRSALGVALTRARREYEEHLGGRDSVPVGVRNELEALVLDEFLVRHAERTLLATGAVVDRRRRQFFPVVLQLFQLRDSVHKRKSSLGLLAPKKPPTWQEIMARYSKPAEAAQGGTASPPLPSTQGGPAEAPGGPPSAAGGAPSVAGVPGSASAPTPAAPGPASREGGPPAAGSTGPPPRRSAEEEAMEVDWTARTPEEARRLADLSFRMAVEAGDEKP